MVIHNWKESCGRRWHMERYGKFDEYRPNTFNPASSQGALGNRYRLPREMEQLNVKVR